MKLIITIIASIMLVGCPKDKSPNETVTSTSSKAINTKGYQLHVTFEDGPLRGKKHVFTKKSGNYTAQLYLDSKDGVTRLFAQGLGTEDGLSINGFVRYFEGAVKKGSHKSIKSKGKTHCGNLGFSDLNQKTSAYHRIYGEFTGCNDIKISSIASEWKEENLHKKRRVSGSFTDTLKMDIRFDDNSEKTISSKVTVEFYGNEIVIKH